MNRRWLWGLGVVSGLLVCASLALAGTQGRSPRSFSHLGRGAETPALGVDARGDQTVAWTEQEGDQSGQSFFVVAAARPVGGHWSVPVRLSTMSENPVEPVLAVNSSGAAVIAWIQIIPTQHGYGSEVEARTRPAASARWGRAVRVARARGSLVGLQAGIDARGGVTLVWSGYGTRRSPVLSAAGSTSTGRWRRAHTLGRLGIGVLYPQLAVNGRGDALVVWQQATRETGAAPSFTIHYLEKIRYRPSGGHWSPAVTLGRLSEPDYVGASVWAPETPDLALDARGGATVMWLSIGRAGHAVLVAHRAAGARHWTRARLSAVDLSQPVIGSDAGGGVTIAWSGRHGRLFVTQSRNGVDWPRAAGLAGPPAGLGAWLSVGAQGNAILGWFTSPARIFVSVRRQADARWTHATHIGQGVFPQAALTRSGTAAIIWLRSPSPRHIPVIDVTTYPTG